MNEERIQLSEEQVSKIRKDLEDKDYNPKEIDKLMDEIEKRGVIKQTQDGCDHPILSHVTGTYYQCAKCNYVFHFTEAEVYQPDGYFEETLKVLKTITGVDKWKKKYLK